MTPYRRQIGTQTVDFIFYPIIVTGKTAAIYPHAGVLAYGQKYDVTLEPGTVLDATGATYGGIAEANVWTFTTKPAGPVADATAVSGHAGTGLNTLIGGVVVTGSQPKRMLIRGAGPTLTSLGVGNALGGPVWRFTAAPRSSRRMQAGAPASTPH